MTANTVTNAFLTIFSLKVRTLQFIIFYILFPTFLQLFYLSKCFTYVYKLYKRVLKTNFMNIKIKILNLSSIFLFWNNCNGKLFFIKITEYFCWLYGNRLSFEFQIEFHFVFLILLCLYDANGVAQKCIHSNMQFKVCD